MTVGILAVRQYGTILIIDAGTIAVRGSWGRIVLACWGSVLLSAAPVYAAFSQAHLARLLRNKVEDVRELAANPKVIRAVCEHNAKGQSLDAIKKIDKDWLAAKGLSPLKKSLQENKVGQYFKTFVEFNESIYSEIFLTDNQGATVATYPATTDYWQGDETKWTEAFNAGEGKVYIGAVEFDESSQVNSVQISVPVLVEAKTIGVLVVGVKLSYLQAKYLYGHKNGLANSLP